MKDKFQALANKREDNAEGKKKKKKRRRKSSDDTRSEDEASKKDSLFKRKGRPQGLKNKYSLYRSTPIEYNVFDKNQKPKNVKP